MSCLYEPAGEAMMLIIYDVVVCSFCDQLTLEIIERWWRPDAEFEDPSCKCVGFNEYASQFFALVSRIFTALSGTCSHSSVNHSRGYVCTPSDEPAKYCAPHSSLTAWCSRRFRNIPFDGLEVRRCVSLLLQLSLGYIR